MVMKNRTSLYSRLLKYQDTNEKSNLENFRTEMLCDYPTRITENESAFVSERSNVFQKF